MHGFRIETAKFQSTLPAWGATAAYYDFVRSLEFQSTLPAWGATSTSHIFSSFRNFNPRSPHGERQEIYAQGTDKDDISIHAPRMGSDTLHSVRPLVVVTFQSTLPAWGATFLGHISCNISTNFNPRSPHGERQSLDVWHLSQKFISIHAPRMGSDFYFWCFVRWFLYFNPRSPHGERQYSQSIQQ